MATTHSSSAMLETPQTRKPGRAPLKLLREPLLHFLLLGALLFAVDHVIHGRGADPRTIVIDATVEREARDIFTASRGRPPNEAEMKALTAVWLDNEVLYREGLALQVDRGDSAIRERVIFKALSMVDANVKLPEITDQELRAWFEAHREKYDEPARYSFDEGVLAGASSENAVRRFVAALNAGTQGDIEASLRVFKERPLANLVQSYGAEFPKALAEAPAGEWRALQARDGWHAIKVEAIAPVQPADFERQRNVVLQDWKDATASEQRSAAVRALAQKYTIKYQPGAP